MKNMKLPTKLEKYENSFNNLQGIEVGAEKVKDTLNATAEKLNTDGKPDEKESLLRYHQENMEKLEEEQKKDD